MLGLQTLTMGVVLLSCAGFASASVVPVFDSETTTSTSSTFTYSIYFTSNGGSETFTSGNFFTLYDTGPDLSATITGSFIGSQSLTGTTAPLTTPPDSSSILNLTETYNGSTVAANTTVTATITFPGVLTTTNGYYSSTDTSTLGTDSLAGRVLVPLVVVPEPATWTILAAGAALSAALLRRRVVKI